MSSLVLDGVTKRFGDTTAVTDVSLTARSGELLVLVGPSGCGKTTLLRLIAGLEHPTEGVVAIGGTNVTDVPARKRDVAMVFEDFALFPHLSVRENVSFNLRMRGEHDDVDDRVAWAAELLDIQELLDRSIDELSGGQKQRVALGRAIAAEPRTFLLDEPLANLDASLRETMQTEILQLQRRLDVTTVHVTHDQTEALTLGDRVAVMHDGRIEQVDTPATVYDRPATLFVARFVGTPTMNSYDGRYDADAGEVRVSDRFALPARPDRGDGSHVVVGVRPEHLRLHPDPDDDHVTVCTADVSIREFRGADQIIHLDPETLPRTTCRVHGTGPVEGETVTATVAPGDVHIFDASSGARLSAPIETTALDDTGRGAASSEGRGDATRLDAGEE